MRIEVVTLFPALIDAALGFGVLGRALERGLLQVGTEDPRLHTEDAHRTVDDRPYGGGPGMVLKPEPLCAAIAAAAARLPEGSLRIALSAQGELLTRGSMVRELAALPGLLLVAGRYEGIDERVLETVIDRELSIGDYVVSGGELPALVMIDALARLQPGSLGDERSNVEESFSTARLDWPLHAARGVRGTARAARAEFGRSRGDRALASGAGARSDVAAASGAVCARAADGGAAGSVGRVFAGARRRTEEEVIMSQIIQILESERMTRTVPEFKPGDTVVVQIKVIEGDRERVQAYEGVVITAISRASIPPSPSARSLMVKA